MTFLRKYGFETLLALAFVGYLGWVTVKQSCPMCSLSSAVYAWSATETAEPTEAFAPESEPHVIQFADMSPETEAELRVLCSQIDGPVVFEFTGDPEIAYDARKWASALR